MWNSLGFLIKYLMNIWNFLSKICIYKKNIGPLTIKLRRRAVPCISRPWSDSKWSPEFMGYYILPERNKQRDSHFHEGDTYNYSPIPKIIWVTFRMIKFEKLDLVCVWLLPHQVEHNVGDQKLVTCIARIIVSGGATWGVRYPFAFFYFCCLYWKFVRIKWKK